MDERTIARFYAKVDTSGGIESCHEWRGSRNASGYGVVRVDNRQRAAHRIAWQIANGPIPDGMMVRHDCDNPPCVNFRHLQTGTAYDNNHDRLERHGYTRGDQHWASKLSEADISLAFDLRRGGLPYMDIANRLGVSYAAIHYVLNGASWRHLDRPSDLPAAAPRSAISNEVVEVARRMRDDEGEPWRRIEAATGYTRIHLMRRLPPRPGRNQEARLTPAEADEAVRLRADGLSWTKLARHFGNRISRMGLYFACRDGLRWWREAEDRVRSGADLRRHPVRGKVRAVVAPNGNRRGVDHHNARLDADAIETARGLRLMGWSWLRIAERLGVSRTTASRAASGITWRHVGPAPEMPASVKGRRGRAL